jgi:hypothetical protein
MVESGLILKRSSASRPSGEWNDDDFDVLADGVAVGRIMKGGGSAGWEPMAVDAGLRTARRQRAEHGYEPTREAAMAAFAKSWRRG